MLIFLHGPDDFRRSQKKRDLIAEFQKKHSNLGLDFFDFEKNGSMRLAAEEGIEKFREFARNQSIFESAKLAVLENIFEIEAKQLAKLLQPYLENRSITILLSEHEKPVKALNFLVEKPAIFQKFENLEGAAWEQFINSEAKKLGLVLAGDAIRFLASVYQGNSWALVTELQKLSALKSSISKKDLDELDLEAAPNYWTLLNGVKSPDLRTRLYALEKLLSLNDPPAKLFNILASQWSQKLPQFAESDFAVKSGKLEYEEALLEAVL
jgi:DNA polymerase III delta subunit